MTLDLAGRRNLLRHALQSSDPADYSGFAAAVAGADPDDRASLARTLPPSRLFREEGPTPRAAFVVTALGKPTLAVDTITPVDVNLKEKYSKRRAAMATAVLAAAGDRETGWLTEFVDLLAERDWWGEGLVWPVCRGLVRDRELPLESLAYLTLFVRQATGENPGDPGPVHGARIKQRLRDEPDLAAALDLEGPPEHLLAQLVIVPEHELRRVGDPAENAPPPYGRDDSVAE